MHRYASGRDAEGMEVGVGRRRQCRRGRARLGCHCRGLTGRRQDPGSKPEYEGDDDDDRVKIHDMLGLADQLLADVSDRKASRAPSRRSMARLAGIASAYPPIGTIGAPRGPVG